MGKAELGVVMVGIPILYELETRDSLDWLRLMMFTVLGAGGLLLINESESVDLKKTPSEIIKKFDGVFDDLEDLTWSR